MMEKRKTLICLLAFVFMLSLVSLVVVGPSPGHAGSNGQININTATVEELVQLPRVGEKVAERIVHYRKQYGSFKTVNDLKTVRGIGDKIFDQIRPMVCVK